MYVHYYCSCWHSERFYSIRLDSMQTVLNDNLIAEEAITQLQEETGLTFRLEDDGADRFLCVEEMGAKFKAEIKKWTTHAPIGALVSKMRDIAKPGDGILIADYINPQMADKLKAAGIPFIDTAGNAYLNRRPVYVYVVGKKPKQRITTKAQAQGLAFQSAGLKVIYALLTDRELINAPNREIAERANVALGAVGWIIRDLTEQGFLIGGKNKKRRLENFYLLLDKWVDNYLVRLRNKMLIGKFTTEDPSWWQRIDPHNYNAKWGEEVAAAKYTNYLTPKDATLYIPPEMMNLFLKDARLRRIQNHEKPYY